MSAQNAIGDLAVVHRCGDGGGGKCSGRSGKLFGRSMSTFGRDLTEEGAEQWEQVRAVTHSSQLLLQNPRALPPTRPNPPPARRYPSRVTRFPRSSRGGSLDGPKIEAGTCFRCAASSRRRAAPAVYRRRRARGISVVVARHFRTRPVTGRADTARPACRQRERSTSASGATQTALEESCQAKLAEPSLFPAKHLIPSPRFS